MTVEDTVEGKLDGSQRDMLVRLDERSRDLREDLKELKASQQQAFKDMREALLAHSNLDDTRFKEANERASSLELWRNRIVTVIAVIGALLTFLMWLVGTFYKGQGTIVERKTETETIQRPAEPKEKQ